VIRRNAADYRPINPSTIWGSRNLLYGDHGIAASAAQAIYRISFISQSRNAFTLGRCKAWGG